MRIILKQAASFCGKDYKQGVHALPEEVSYDSYFQSFLKIGLAVDADAPEHKVLKSETLNERNLRLAEVLASSSADEEVKSESAVDDVEQKDEQPSGKQKQKHKR